MGDERYDNSSSMESSDETGYKEQTRIAEVAASTLCRLNSLKKQMKDWRDDRMKLRSNIWRLKLALRVAERETDDTVHANPLVEHQRAEIKRLESVNRDLKKEIGDIKSALFDSDGQVAFETGDKLAEIKQEYLVEREHLNNEILYLKSRLNEVEEGHEHSSEVQHLECKLKHFMMVDHTMEIIFTDIVNKVVETIANLSEELVSVNDRLHRTRLRNDGLYVEVDKLKAMLRFKNGNPADYQKRIAELENLTKRMKGELNKFKMHFGDGSWADWNWQENLKAVVQVGNELRHKLRNDRDALLAAGDPDCLKYMQKIIELRVGLRQLHVELVKLGDDRRTPSPQENDLKHLPILNWTLLEITGEIDKLKSNHLKKHCKIGDTEGMEYLTKIEELEAIVEKARATMNGLNRRAEGSSNEWKDIEKLEGFVGRMCYEIKQLEVIVTSSDRSGTFKRIEQLEELIVRLKTESNEKDERANALEQKLFGAENLLEERINELENGQRKIAALMEENRDLKGRVKKTEEKTSELLHELEHSKKELVQLQQVKREASVAKKGMQNLQNEKEGLLKEMGKIRDTLQKKNEEIKNVLGEKDTMEKTLNGRITELMKNLQSARKENERVQSKVNELEGVKKGTVAVNTEKEVENARLLQEARDTNAELERQIADLKSKLECGIDDNKRLEASYAHLESKIEMLLCQLCAERNNAEEKSQELAKLKSDYNDSEAERANLKREKEQLNAKLTTLKVENELLEKSVKQAHTKCNALENEIDKYKFERDSLCEEIKNFRMSKENLTNKLKEAETVLNGTGDRIRRLEFENSKLYNDLNGLTIKNAGFEGRVQILLSQKDDYETRMKELNDENSALKDQLNEFKTANEYSSLESNKLRAERDKMKSENTLLRTTVDEVKQSNRMLQAANEELKLKLNEIHSECRILVNQLKILEMMNATLKKEKELLEQEFLNSLEIKTKRADEEESIVCSDSRISEQNLRGKVVNETKRNSTKSGKHTNKTKKSDELKKLKVENESLRFEILNLKSQNIETKMQLSRMVEKLQIPGTAEDNASGITIKPLSNKLEIVNLYYKEIKSYSDHCPENAGAVAPVGPSTVCAYSSLIPEQDNGMEIDRLIEIIKKLKVENVALKMELNSLRCSMVVHFTEDEKRRNELRTATEEIQALKAELTKLRDEKESLWFRLDTTGAKLDRLESEKAALKDELYTLRKINSELKYKTNVLEQDYQKLKEKSIGFEGSIVRAIKRIKKYTLGTESQDDPSDDLKFLLKKYISSEEVLRSLEHGIDTQGK